MSVRAHRFANLILVSGVLLALVGAIVASPLLDSGRPQDDSSRQPTARQWTFVTVLLAIAGLLAFSLRLSLSVRITLAMTLLSLGVGLYGVEAALRWRLHDGKWLAAERLGYEYDSRTRFEAMTDLRQSGEDAWPTVFATALLGGKEMVPILPLGGISRVTTVHCNENGVFLIYRSDEHGFHNPPGLWDHVDLDVAVVGDSFTHGNCVRSEENAVARIRADFPATFGVFQAKSRFALSNPGPPPESPGLRAGG